MHKACLTISFMAVLQTAAVLQPSLEPSQLVPRRWQALLSVASIFCIAPWSYASPRRHMARTLCLSTKRSSVIWRRIRLGQCALIASNDCYHWDTHTLIDGGGHTSKHYGNVQNWKWILVDWIGSYLMRSSFHLADVSVRAFSFLFSACLTIISLYAFMWLVYCGLLWRTGTIAFYKISQIASIHFAGPTEKTSLLWMFLGKFADSCVALLLCNLQNSWQWLHLRSSLDLMSRTRSAFNARITIFCRKSYDLYPYPPLLTRSLELSWSQGNPEHFANF